MKERIVIKVGTGSLLMSNEQPRNTFETVAAGIKELADDYDAALVSSGAIGFGVRRMELRSRPAEVPRLQALSGIGQVALIQRWQEAFHDTPVNQVLLTARELEDSHAKDALTGQLAASWDMGAVPVVNENDAITSEEITFGDNDRLAALFAVVIGARRLVLLTDQDGIQKNFGTSDQDRLDKVSLSEAEQYLQTTKSSFGTGGMQTKLIAARIALEQGIDTYIGSAGSDIQDILASKSGTKIVQ
jgi:glutamate 5-kinase